MGVVAGDVTAAAVREALTRGRRDVAGGIFRWTLVAALGLTVLVLATLLVSVVADAWPVLSGRPVTEEVRADLVDTSTDPPTVTQFGVTEPLEVRIDPDGRTRYFRVRERSFATFLTNPVNFTDPAANGIRQGIVGTFGIAVMVIVVAIPMGVAAAVWLEEYAPDNRLRRFIDVNIRNLAGVPSIVYGILGFTVLVTALRGLTGGRSLLSGGLTLALLVLPIVIITAAEAVRAVPRELREAAYGIGATRWEVTRDHVLPYAMPGILTGAILSLARALGEAAPLILVGAQTGFFTDPAGGVIDHLRGVFTALPMLVFNFTRQPGEAIRVEGAAATIVVLLAIVLFVNAAGILLRNRYERRRRGAA